MAVVVTGSGSGMGAATAAPLRRSGRDVIGVDLAGSEITADLSRPEDRQGVLDAVTDRDIEAVATFAGVSGFGDRPGSLSCPSTISGRSHSSRGSVRH